MRFHVLSLAAAMVAVAASPAAAKTINVSAEGADANEKLQEALILAEPGDVVQLGAGTWTLTDGLSLDVDNVTLRGAGTGEGGSILDFSGQQGAGEGLLVTSDDVLLTDFAHHCYAQLRDMVRSAGAIIAITEIRTCSEHGLARRRDGCRGNAYSARCLR